jgi:hypothetical protein
MPLALHDIRRILQAELKPEPPKGAGRNLPSEPISPLLGADAARQAELWCKPPGGVNLSAHPQLMMAHVLGVRRTTGSVCSARVPQDPPKRGGVLKPKKVRTTVREPGEGRESGQGARCQNPALSSYRLPAAAHYFTFLIWSRPRVASRGTPSTRRADSALIVCSSGCAVRRPNDWRLRAQGYHQHSRVCSGASADY